MKIQNIPFSKSLKYFILMSLDAVLMATSLWLAFFLVQGNVLELKIESLLIYFGLLPVASVIIFYRVGVYRTILLYMGMQSVLQLVKSVSMITALLAAGVYLDTNSPFTPKAVPVFWMICLVLVGGARVSVKIVLQNLIHNFRPKEAVVIYGAGSSGTQLAVALLNGSQYLPVAFIDDDEAMIGTLVHGIRVHSASAIDELIKNYSVRQILLALPSATHGERKRILNHLELFPVHVKTVPDLFSMVTGKVGVDQIKDVDIEDLLGRNVVPPYPHLMTACIQNTSVMITGAGGSIGSELCKQILKLQPLKIILFDNSEYGLYKIENDLRELLLESKGLGEVEIISVLGTVRDKSHVEHVLNKFRVRTIYHAAAYKHLPMVEKNIVEGVQNNIFGTLSLSQAAEASGVENFVFVSTDKAVRPSSVMGATKRFAEQILQALAARDTATRFSMVRFGNVLGSSGSVVPLFRKQIRHGGPVTVTHPEVTRYFMTVQEAAQLVIQAGSMATGGDVFVLDMHEPVKILDLAHKMIHLMGYMVKDENNRSGDIGVKYTGLRPGEKLYEELLIGEAVTGTDHPKIMRAEEDYIPMERLEELLSRLEKACANLDQIGIREVLSEAIGGFVSRGNEVDPALQKEMLEEGVIIQHADKSKNKVTKLFP